MTRAWVPLPVAFLPQLPLQAAWAGRILPLRTVTFTPVDFSKGFNAVAKPVASPPENSFHDRDTAADFEEAPPQVHSTR